MEKRNFLINTVTNLGIKVFGGHLGFRNGVFRNGNKRLYSSDEYIQHNLYDIKNVTFEEIKDNFKETPKIKYKRESVSFHLINNINLLLNHRYFRTEFQKNYKNLDKVLLNGKIVSTVFKIKFDDGSYRNLGTQFGFKFNLNEFKSWNFNKSPYIKVYSKYYHTIFKQNIHIHNPFSEYFDFEFRGHNAPLNLDQLYIRLFGCLIDYMEEYYEDEIDCFIIIFTTISDNLNHDKLVKNVNNIPFKRNVSNIKDIRKSFKSSLLPFTLDESLYGKKLYSTSSKGFLGERYPSISRTFIDSNEKIKRVVTDVSINKTQKEIYSLVTNELLEKFIDEKIDEETFTRHNPAKKTSVTIRKDKITRTSSFIKLPLIKFIPPKHSNNTFNKHIGTFDIETYYNTISGKNEVYSLGFSYAGGNILISKPYVKTYYLDVNQKSSDIVLACINDMLESKYHNGIFYTHNLGGYDVVFILKILGDHNNTVNDKYYKMDVILRDNRILKLKISLKKSKSVTNTIFLVDSLALLPMSLDSLGESFSTSYKKSLFPYTFVNENTLYYVGKTPDIEFYHNHKKDVSCEEYLSIKNNNWDLKKETIKYLEIDLISLLQIMYEFSQYIFEKHHIQITECLTITSLAVKIFLENHYKKDGCLPLIKNREMYNDIKQAYYGGLSEVYKRYGENLYYYDVNSLYPFSALKDTIGNLCTYIETLTEEDSLDLQKDNLFGFFYCDVKTNEKDYLGLLPFRQLGLLTYPLGEFSGWFFSPQIEFAQNNGYNIKIRKGYKFNKISNIFCDYVETIYAEKNQTTGAKRLISKLLLNSLLGRFGMHIDKKNTSLINDNETYMNLISRYPVYDEKIISKDLYLVTHNTEISKSICEQHGVNYIDVLNDSKSRSGVVEEFNFIRNVSVGVSAGITAYSSIFMSQIKQYVLSVGGEIYYTDTDSLVTNIPLPDEFVGKDIGMFKLEHKIIRGYFISSKLYCIVVWDEEKNKEKVIIKSKGVYSTKLNENDFISLLNNEHIKHGVKGDTKKNYSEGYVNIGTKTNIHLNPNNYLKRIKIFDSITKKWIDTKPLIVGCNSINNNRLHKENKGIENEQKVGKNKDYIDNEYKEKVVEKRIVEKKKKKI